MACTHSKNALVFMAPFLLCAIVIASIMPMQAIALEHDCSSAAQTAARTSAASVVANATWEPVQRTFYVNKSKTQAVVITSWDSSGGYEYGSIWFVKGSTCKKLYTSDKYLYDHTPKLVSVKGGKLFIVEEGAYGSGSTSRVFFIRNGAAKQVPHFCSDLKKVKGNNFIGVKGAFDLGREVGSSLKTGHSYKPYYYKWNGKRFVEYGGKAVKKKQLKKAKNGKRIVKAIEKKGKIGKIWYRSNGLINVNYTTRSGSHISYHNVTLKLKKGKLSYYGKPAFDKGFGGPYKKRGGGTKVSYPKKLPRAIR